LEFENVGFSGGMKTYGETGEKPSGEGENQLKNKKIKNILIDHSPIQGQ